MSLDRTERYSAEDFLRATRARRADPNPEPETQPRKSRITRIAVLLAFATIASTFLSGVLAWEPLAVLSSAIYYQSLMPIRQALLANWVPGLQFALALMAILTAHELGHYFLTIIYKVPSTPPLFIPFPLISPIGTMGAVILMQSGSANRRQIFDIGLAGPLAGLVVAFPIIGYGILNPEPVALAADDSVKLFFGQPLLIQWMASWLDPEHAKSFVYVANTNASPFLMAGWVGLLVTGINMMPLGQLDGGHVTFGLLGKNSYYIAISAAIAAVAFMIYTQVYMFLLMMILVFLMGLRHPPSSDDSKSLGFTRQVIGWLSLSLPILCIPARPLLMM